MSEQRHFEVTCPNNHDQTIKYSQSEFEKILSSDTLVFHCNTCDTDWTPSGQQVADIRKQFRQK